MWRCPLVRVNRERERACVFDMFSGLQNMYLFIWGSTEKTFVIFIWAYKTYICYILSGLQKMYLFMFLGLLNVDLFWFWAHRTRIIPIAVPNVRVVSVTSMYT